MAVHSRIMPEVCTHDMYQLQWTRTSVSICSALLNYTGQLSSESKYNNCDNPFYLLYFFESLLLVKVNNT